MLKRGCLRCILSIASLALALVTGGALAELKEGSNYATLSPPQPTGAKGKIEVTEFFWYGCQFCYGFEPVISQWLKTLPKDVDFRFVPADFGRWTPGARLFYALDAIGEEHRLHGELFDAIHFDDLDFNSEPEVADWLTKKGVDRQKFIDAYNSVTVQANTRRAHQMTKGYDIRDVPTVVIGGKYRTSNTMAGGYDELIKVMDEMITRLRAEQNMQK